MRKILLSFFALVVLVGCIREEGEDDTVDEVQLQDSLPEFTVVDPVGGTLCSADLKGDAVLLVFFSTGCPDCQQALPVIDTVWRVLRDTPLFRLVAIAREEQASSISDYWEKAGFTLPYYLDPERAVYSLFAASGIPRIYLVSPAGVVVWLAVEELSLSADRLAGMIRELFP